MPYDARELANYILDLSDEKDIELSNMKLLKIIFFAHGWYLAKYRKQLVLDQFQAWKFGPVLATVYNEFKEYGENPIKSRARKINVFSGNKEKIFPNIEQGDQVFLELIIAYYAKYEAAELSRISHAEGGPWDTVWRRFEARASVGMKIKNSDIESFFSNLLAKQAIH